MPRGWQDPRHRRPIPASGRTRNPAKASPCCRLLTPRSTRLKPLRRTRRRAYGAALCRHVRRFINRFITRPLYVQQYGQTPRFIESWQGDRRTSFRLRDMGKMPSLELDWFEFDWMLRATLKDDWIPLRYQRLLAPLISARRGDLEQEPRGAAAPSWPSGNSQLCRFPRAYGWLPQAARDLELFGTLLAARFSEVVVDEAQDCGPEELRDLGTPQESGVTVIVVADLDQSIFEFRRAEPEGVRAFADGLGVRLPLDGNWRSSPAICALNNSLRHGNRKETALGINAPVRCRSSSWAFEATERYLRVESAVSPRRAKGRIVFLAHRGSDARSCAEA